MTQYDLVVSCEHGGCDIPPAYAHVFEGQPRKQLKAFDVGSLPLAREIALRGEAPFYAHTISPLLVDVYQARHSASLFSAYSRGLDPAEKAAILSEIYTPFNDALMADVGEHIERGLTVVHLSVHTFPDELGQREDMGLQFDDTRTGERRFCQLLAQHVRRAWPMLDIAHAGVHDEQRDVQVAFMRWRFPAESYLGVELSLNQCLLEADVWAPLLRDLPGWVLTSVRELDEPTRAA